MCIVTDLLLAIYEGKPTYNEYLMVISRYHGDSLSYYKCRKSKLEVSVVGMPDLFLFPLWERCSSSYKFLTKYILPVSVTFLKVT